MEKVLEKKRKKKVPEHSGDQTPFWAILTKIAPC